MAKYLVKFNNNEYLIDETKLEPAIARLATHLTSELQGTGATVTLGGVRYSLNGDKINTSASELADYLETIAGTDMKATVGGQEYGLSRNALSNAYDKMDLSLSELTGGDTPVEPDEPELPTSKGLAYELNDDEQSYSVIGIGTCTDADVVIPDIYEGLPVTSIGDMAFDGCTSLTSVTIPDSVTSIGEYVFEDCTSLTSVTIGDGVTSIGRGSFYGCSSLTGVVIPEGVTALILDTFRKCSNLASVIIPSSVTTINFYVFAYCTNLTNITFNGTVAQWEAIDKREAWNHKTPAEYIQCSDGRAENAYSGWPEGE